MKEAAAINISVTSREEILLVCRGIVAEKGLDALNMRGVAAECRIALGSVYTHFSSKDELVAATVESVWKDILHMGRASSAGLSFPEYVGWIYGNLRRGSGRYPGFFRAHSSSFAGVAKPEARNAMARYLSHISSAMKKSLDSDPGISANAFGESFGRDEFIDFILGSLLALLAADAGSCSVLTEMIKRSIYR